MSGEQNELGAGARIPEPCSLVIRSGDNTRAVGRIRGGIDAIAMPVQDTELSACVCIPYPRGTVSRSGDDARPIRRVRGGFDGAAMPGQHSALQVGCADVLKNTDGLGRSCE